MRDPQEGQPGAIQGQAARPAPEGQALAEGMGSIQEAQEANKRIRTPTRHGCSTTLSNPLCPLELDDPEDIPNVGDIKEKYVPYIRNLRESQNPWHQEALPVEEALKR